MTQAKGTRSKRARTGSPYASGQPSPMIQSPDLTDEIGVQSGGRGGPEVQTPSDDVPSEEQQALLYHIYLSTWETGEFCRRQVLWVRPLNSTSSSLWELDVKIRLPFLVSMHPQIFWYTSDMPRFGDDNVSESSVSISSLCNQLDQSMNTESETPSPRTYTGVFPLASDEDKDRQIRQSLDRVIHSYAARWLHLYPPNSAKGGDSQAIARKLWREARVDMLKVINRPSKSSWIESDSPSTGLSKLR